MANMSQKEYQTLVDKQSPPSPMGKNMLTAFVVGGLICVVGELLSHWYKSMGLDKMSCSCLVSVTLIFLSILFTGLGLYELLAKYAGAGTLVPITGFANAVAAPAIEFKAEGYILGVGAKMFTIAGPVIVYGTLASVVAGIIYYFIA